MDGHSMDNSGNRVCEPNVADPVAASGITLELVNDGQDYEQELEAGQLYIVSVGEKDETTIIVFAGITGVTSVPANREWIWQAGQDYIFRMPIGKTTLYIETDNSGTNVFFRKLA